MGKVCLVTNLLPKRLSFCQLLMCRGARFAPETSLEVKTRYNINKIGLITYIYCDQSLGVKK
jgi:hypothetical protein